MTAPAKVIELIDLFQRNAEAYCGGHYNETQVRQEFINPLFKCLGWDMDNAQGYAEAYKDLIHEDAIKIGGANKAPDYCFRIGGARKFFLEAKKPAINLKDDPAPAYQLRRYAWSAKLPLSILTSFAELAVYDCRIKPAQTDKASVGRLLYMTTADLAARWDELAGIFAREAVLKGSFDKYADTAKGKKGTATVDAAFLQEIEGWREMLAKNLAVRNPQLSQRELNYAVQVTIDRIIFLRMCEDRGIERYGQLLGLVNGPSIYGRLKEVFQSADERYNSGLFHFHKEKDQAEDPDELTPSLAIDDKQLKDIIQGLYYPESPYEFSVLSAEILGQVYEQFLGKVIRLTAGHQAKVEDKPEVKKAGGVYYTPAYIVDYIVKNTVGKLLEGKTPRRVSKLRVLDPACGSGSFLLGAYRCLHDWHRDRYIEDGPAKHTKEIYQGPGGGWRLTTAEKKRILLSNIYGVDIDTQAVEVTKLSLLLKVLEGESQQTLEQQLKLFHERALPDLASNIKCGNSLIGPDFYEGQQMLQFDDDERHRINVFDWNASFPQIIQAGGFDAVIGNPPYLRIQLMKEWAPAEVDWYKQRYVSASKGNYDIYLVFVERGLSLVGPRGLVGMILPHKFFNSQYGEPLRRLISEGKHLTQVVHFGAQQIFPGATTYTCLLFLDKAGSNECRLLNVLDLAAWRTSGIVQQGTIPATKIGAAEWNFTVGNDSGLLEKLQEGRRLLGDIAKIFVGLQTSADDVFIMDLIEEKPDSLRLRSKILEGEWMFEKGILFPLISGTDVNGYQPLPERQYILFPYALGPDAVELMDFAFLSREFPKTAAYMLKNRKRLEDRENGKMNGPNWYGYIYLKNMRRQALQKICVPRLVERLHAAYDVDGRHFLDNVDVGGITLAPAYLEQGLLYLLALLNSRLLGWYFPFVSAPFRGGWRSANRQFLSQLPIRLIDFSKPSDTSRHARIVELVEQMRALHERLAAAKVPHDKTLLQGQIDATDRQIDRLVYELYELTEDEIRIVEGTQ